MATASVYYELWDDASGNRVGGSFDTLDAARALLLDVLRVNGSAVASEMAILAFEPVAAGHYEPSTVLEGADLVAQAGESAARL